MLPFGLEEYQACQRECLADGVYLKKRVSRDDHWNETEFFLPNEFKLVFLCLFVHFNI